MHAVVGDDTAVAKVYLPGKSAPKEAKVRAMVRVGTRAANITWPTDTLYDGSSFTGFLMPKLPAGSQSIYRLITARREQAFPGHDWGFLVAVAENLARLFANLHHNDIVIGDVNSGNVFVTADGRGLTLSIDTDSYHLTLEGVLYPTEVHFPSYTAPEVLAKTITDTQRSSSQDVWALGVLVFQLLFMGAHPAHGVGTPDEEVESIKARCFPYSPQSIGTPPPRSPPLTGVGVTLAALFERTFLAVDPSSRPTAAAYVAALGALRAALRRCGQNRRHVYVSTAAACPWCALPVDFFPPTHAPQTTALPAQAPSPELDVAAVWQKILGIGPPVAPMEAQEQLLPAPPEHRVSVRETYSSAGGMFGLASAVAATLVSAAGDSASVQEAVGGGAACLGVAGAWIGWVIGSRFERPTRPDPHAQLRPLWSQLRAAHAALHEAVAEGHRAHTTERAALQRARDAILATEGKRQSREAEAIRDLQSSARESALRRRFLEAGDVAGVGDVRIRKLQSFHIETAWDVLEAANTGASGQNHAPNCPSCGQTMRERHGRRGTFWGCPSFPRCRGTRPYSVSTATNRLEEVPTIGPVLAESLVEWAEGVEARLNLPLAPRMVSAAKATVAAELDREIREATAKLQSGPATLQALVAHQQRRIREAAYAYRHASDTYRYRFLS